MSTCTSTTKLTVERLHDNGPTVEERDIPCVLEEGHEGMHDDGKFVEWTRCHEDHLCCDDPSTTHSHFLDTEDCPRCHGDDS